MSDALFCLKEFDVVFEILYKGAAKPHYSQNPQNHVYLDENEDLALLSKFERLAARLNHKTHSLVQVCLGMVTP